MAGGVPDEVAVSVDRRRGGHQEGEEESMIPLAILDLSPVTDGGDAALALRNTLDLALHVERCGYRRYLRLSTTYQRRFADAHPACAV